MDQSLLQKSASSSIFRSPAFMSHVLKLLNCIVSISFLLYFWIELGPTWKAVEFIQIIFLSLLLVLVTIPLANRLLRLVMIIAVMVVMVAWLYLLAVLWSKELSLSIAFQVSVYICGLLWCAGIIIACFVSEKNNSNGEIDLIIYLVLLNVVSAWGNPDSFNNELHLLLDVRTFILVFNCLHKLQKNEELLRYPAFISIVLLTVVTFILSESLFGKYITGNATNPVAIVVFVIFGIIGIILLAEIYYSRYSVKNDDSTNGSDSSIDRL